MKKEIVFLIYKQEELNIPLPVIAIGILKKA